MTGYETFALFNSLKLHFNRESYDYFKYNGKSNISVDAFENRRDKYHFHKLSRKYTNKEDMELFFVWQQQRNNLGVYYGSETI